MKQKSSTHQDYWSIELQRWRESGLSGLQYCKDNTLSYHRFAYWRKKLSVRHNAADGEVASGSGFARVIQQPAQQIPSTSGDSGLILTLPGGITLQGIRDEHLSLIGPLLHQLQKAAPGQREGQPFASLSRGSTAQ